MFAQFPFPTRYYAWLSGLKITSNTALVWNPLVWLSYALHSRCQCYTWTARLAPSTYANLSHTLPGNDDDLSLGNILAAM